MAMSKECSIVWFRRDLRLEDNPALVEGAKGGGAVVPVYIWCPEEEAQFYPGRVSRWWLKQSLMHLDQSLRALGVPLITIRASDTVSALLELIKSTGATRVFYNHLYDPVSLVRDHKVKQQLMERGCAVQSFNGDLLYEPWEVRDDNGCAFTSFDAYWEKCLNMPFEPEAPILPPRRLVPQAAPGTVCACTIEELGLEYETEKSSNALLGRAWSPGWSHADKTLDEFLAGPLLDYAKNRQKVNGPTTSLLSPHMHFGELSVRKVLHAVRRKQVVWANEGKMFGEESVNFFLRSIGLREYSRYLCFNFPFTHERSLLGNLRFFPWRLDEGYFKVWRQGRTGYPLVDAGMRELWATGWLHNRIRVVVSSFHVKFLQLPWTWGMKYFWDTLLDADIECDVLGWQYVSGSLPDGHELNRIECPQVQGYKYDPDGEYVRRWLPELARMPTQWIHHPWNAPVGVLKAAGVELGTNYPRPIVERVAAEVRLQQALAEMWECNVNTRATTDNLAEGLGDTIQVRGAGHILHERMVVPRVVIVNREDSSGCSLHDQRVPSIPAATRVSEASCPRNHLGNSSEISHEDSDQVPVSAADGRSCGLDKIQKQQLLPSIRPMFIVKNEATSTEESSSVRKGKPDEGQCSSIPLWSQPRDRLSNRVSEQPDLPSSQGKDTLQLFNCSPHSAGKKVEEEVTSSATHNQPRPTKKQATIDH